MYLPIMNEISGIKSFHARIKLMELITDFIIKLNKGIYGVHIILVCTKSAALEEHTVILSSFQHVFNT